MNVFYLVLGAIVLVIAVVDLLWTTLWVDGGSGPLSSRLTTWIWRGLRTVGEQRSRTLSLAGPLILTLTLVMWVTFFWGGWTLIFAGGEPSLIDTRDQGPISWVEHIYFVAYTLFTMGNGDFTPANGSWQITTSLTTASGMLFITLAVSYVLSVLGAVVDKRSFANTVTGIGKRGEQFVRTGWNGEDLHELDLPLDTLASDVSTLAQQHKAYPVLHYYHSKQAQESSAMAIAIFDEALTILRFGIHNDEEINEALVDTARSSVQSYLQTLSSAFIRPADQRPPSPDLNRLRDADVPTVPDEEFDSTLDNLNERRRKLLGLIKADAWYWPPLNND